MIDRGGRNVIIKTAARVGVLAALAACILVPPVVADEPPLVFDLTSPDAIVEEHTARLLWNLRTDNITRDDTVGWNSLYLEQPEAMSGLVTIDLDAGRIEGEITQRWTCDRDCVTASGSPSWTTIRDTGWTATIGDALLEPSPPGWTIAGSVTIRYDATVEADENPSDCGGEPCYICADRVCHIAGQDVASTSLEGWLDGETLSLAFSDRLEPNVDQMDFSGLRETEFFMSRFSITITGPVQPLPPPDPVSGGVTVVPEEPPPSIVDLPSGQDVPGAIAGSPPGPDESDDRVGETSSTRDHAASEEPAAEADAGSIPVALVVILIVVLVAGGGWLGKSLVRRLFRAKAGSTPIDKVISHHLNDSAPRDDPDAPVTQPVGELTGTLDIRYKTQGTGVDGTTVWIEDGVYPAGTAIKVGPYRYVPIRRGGEILWVGDRRPVHTMPPAGVPDTGGPAGIVKPADSGPTGPVYLAQPLEVTKAGGEVARYDKNHRLWKGEPFGGRTPIFDKAGKQVGTVDTADLERAEMPD